MLVGEEIFPAIYPQQTRRDGPSFQILGYGYNIENPEKSTYSHLIIVPIGNQPNAGRFYAVPPSLLTPEFTFPNPKNSAHWWQIGLYKRLRKSYESPPLQ